MTVEHLEDAPGLIAITCRRVASGFARLDPEIGMLAKHRPDPGRLRHQPFKRFPPCRACFWQQLGAISLRSEEHTSELQSLMRISYAVFCLKKTNKTTCQRNDKQQKQPDTKQH